jgi:hypothetical protein
MFAEAETVGDAKHGLAASFASSQCQISMSAFCRLNPDYSVLSREKLSREALLKICP